MLQQIDKMNEILYVSYKCYWMLVCLIPPPVFNCVIVLTHTGYLRNYIYILSSTPTLLTNKFYGNTAAKLMCTSPVRRSWFESQLRLLTPFCF